MQADVALMLRQVDSSMSLDAHVAADSAVSSAWADIAAPCGRP